LAPVERAFTGDRFIKKSLFDLKALKSPGISGFPKGNLVPEKIIVRILTQSRFSGMADESRSGRLR